MVVLTKATQPALLQQDATQRLQVAVSKVVDVVPAKALAALSPAKLTNLHSFTQVHVENTLGKPILFWICVFVFVFVLVLLLGFWLYV